MYSITLSIDIGAWQLLQLLLSAPLRVVNDNYSIIYVTLSMF